ncbi:MAG: hypothetical protein WC827_03785 [Candidatus Paceibacterota bacterium]|jgi:hypothetical protein
METAIAIFWIVLKIVGWIVLGVLSFMGLCVIIILLFPVTAWDSLMGNDEEQENKHYS